MKLRIAIAVTMLGSGLLGSGAALATSRVPDTTSLSADLSGAAEVPGPGDADGGGTFSATIDRKSTGQGTFAPSGRRSAPSHPSPAAPADTPFPPFPKADSRFCADRSWV